jgi:3-hydroxyisobutyrate dehydrogenase-like beta-hydroxyacid dehydrogenase
VWNRTLAKAAALAADGVQPAYTPADAAADTDVLITMLADGAAVQHVTAGPTGALSVLRPGATWMSALTPPPRSV